MYNIYIHICVYTICTYIYIYIYIYVHGSPFRRRRASDQGAASSRPRAIHRVRHLRMRLFFPPGERGASLFVRVYPVKVAEPKTVPEAEMDLRMRLST